MLQIVTGSFLQAMIMAQQPPAPPDHQQWLKQTDNIIMNVLRRYGSASHVCNSCCLENFYSSLRT